MLAVRLYDAITALHVLSIVVAFGVTFTYPVLFPFLAKNHPQALAPVHEAQDRIGKLVITPFAVLALLTGLHLAIDSEVLDEMWVHVPLGILIVLLGLGGAYFSPKERRAAELARTDPGGAEYQALAQQIAKVGALAAALVVVAIFFMVAKPGA